MKGMMPPGFQKKARRAPKADMPGMGEAPSGRKAGARRGMPNFKSRITKPGGMAKGGAVGGKAGQGSGIGRLYRSK